MRETIGRSITPRYVQEILKCSDSSARRVMGKLEAEDFAESVEGHLEPSTKGSALAMARASPPLRRETAERLISQVIDRARALNRDEKWAYRIGRLAIFGSCVCGPQRPNDVDIACELLPRFKGEEQQLKEQVRRQARDEVFRNVVQWASWPRLEVLRFLKGRARGLSIHELDKWVLNLEDHRIIFTDKARAGGNRTQR
jgi:predicted nucleotidyltransferase